MAPDPGIVDVHLAVGETPYHPLPDVDALLRMMDDQGVAHAALGPVGRWVAVDNAEGNATLAGRAAAYPGRFSVWAVANPWFGDRSVAELRRAFADGARGLKVVPAVQGVGLLSPLLSPLLEVAERQHRPVYVVTGVPVAGEPLQLAELARRWPGVIFVMGRSGRTDFSLDLVPALENAPNIVAETAYNGSSLIADLIRRFGAGRVAFASDAPFNNLGLELDRVRRAGPPGPDLDAVLAGTARTVLGIDADRPAR